MYLIKFKWHYIFQIPSTYEELLLELAMPTYICILFWNSILLYLAWNLKWNGAVSYVHIFLEGKKMFLFWSKPTTKNDVTCLRGNSHLKSTHEENESWKILLLLLKRSIFFPFRAVKLKKWVTSMTKKKEKKILLVFRLLSIHSLKKKEGVVENMLENPQTRTIWKRIWSLSRHD